MKFITHKNGIEHDYRRMCAYCTKDEIIDSLRDTVNALIEADIRVRDLADKYANKAEKDNPQGYGGKPKTLDNSISYWLVSREIWEALNGANGSSDDVQKVVE